MTKRTRRAPLQPKSMSDLVLALDATAYPPAQPPVDMLAALRETRAAAVQVQGAPQARADSNTAVLLLEAQDSFNRAKTEWASGQHVESRPRLRQNVEQVIEWLRLCISGVESEQAKERRDG